MVISEGVLGYLGVKKYIHQLFDTPPFKCVGLPWPGGPAGWSIIPTCQGCGFHPRSGLMERQPLNAEISRTTSQYFSLSQINKEV